MAIDLNKSHYNSDGKKMRVVYPEKEVPEIYPQRKNNLRAEQNSPADNPCPEVYPQREIYPQRETQIKIKEQKEIKPAAAETSHTVRKSVWNDMISLTKATLVIGIIVVTVCTVFGIIRGEDEEPYDPNSLYTTPLLYYTGNSPVSDINTIILETAKTDITLSVGGRNYSEDIKWEMDLEKDVMPMSEAADGTLKLYFNTSEEKFMLKENRKANVSIPYGFTGDIVIKSSNGSIYVSDMIKGNLDIDASDSDIKIENSEISSADIYLEGSDEKNIVDLKYCAGDEFKINAGSCYLDFCAAKKLTLYAGKHTTVSKTFISDETNIHTYEGYIRNDVFNGYTFIGMSQKADIMFSEFNGEAFVDSLNKDVFLDTVSVENVFLNADKGNVTARLCDSKDKYSITEDDGTFLYPETEGSGEYLLNAKTDGHTIDITYGYSDGFDMIDTDEAVKFAERYGITYTDTEKNSNNSNSQ